MEKVELVNLVNQYDKAIRDKGLRLGELVEVKFSTRARRWLGQCTSRTHQGEKKCTLTFATALLELPDKEVVNVIVHEVLHMLIGSRGHDALWYEGMRLVRHWWPEITISEVASSEVSREFNKHLPKRKVYRVKCTKCHCHTKFFRKNEVIKAIERGELRCPYCGDKMEVTEGREEW